MISRRDALKIGVTGVVAPSMISRINQAMASQGDPAVWNWRGNAGHTGEMPGPGPDFGGALGEKWRIPRARAFNRFVGFVGDVLLTVGQGENDLTKTRLVATSSNDGSMLWSRSDPIYGSSSSTEVGYFTRNSNSAAIVENTIIFTLSNGYLWALNAETGEDLWKIDSGYDYVSPPTVADRRAFYTRQGGVFALEFDAAPAVRWDVEINGVNSVLLGVDESLVWVASDESIFALDKESGNEYWRRSGQEFYDQLSSLGWIGIADGMGLFRTHSDELTAVDRQGSVAWNIDDGEFYSGHKWIIRDLVSRLTDAYGDWEGAKIQALSVHDGSEQWECEVFDRWVNPDQPPPIICDGIAYSLLYDSDNDHRVLVAVDPAGPKVQGIRGSNLYPEIVSGGVMFARDQESDEIVCIGTAPGTLHADGQARVTQAATMYGAPNTSSADRGQVTEGTQLTVTGDAETSSEGNWFPVTLTETGTSGWLPAESMEGLDGDIVFESIDPNEFGILTSHQT